MVDAANKGVISSNFISLSTFNHCSHYNFLSSTGKRLYLAQLKKELGDPVLPVKEAESLFLQCPKCKKGTLKQSNYLMQEVSLLIG